MNCLMTREALDDLRSDRLPPDAAGAVQAHLGACPACRAFDVDRAHLRSLLVSERLPPVPASLWHAVRAPAPATAFLPRWAWQVAAILLVAVGLGWLAAAPLRSRLPEAQPATPSLQTVVLAVESATELSEVTLRLMLPPGVHVEGYPGQSELAWQEQLAAGVNRLQIPLRMEPGVPGTLVARVEHEGRHREFHIPLGVGAGGIVNPNRG